MNTTPEFDPLTVPPYPTYHLDVREDDAAAGTWVATLDGRPIPVEDGVAPREALIAEVARRAASRGGSIKAYRATTTDAAGTIWPMVIDQHGTVYDLTPPSKAAAKTARPASAGKNTSKRPQTGLIAGLLAATLIVVGGAAAAAVAFYNAEIAPRSTPTPIGPPPSPSPTPTELPVFAPAGWSSHAAWAVGPLARSQGQSVAVEGSTVAVLVKDPGGTATRLKFVDAATGHATVSSWVEKGAAGDLVRTTLDGETVFALQSGTTLQHWPVTGAEQPAVIALPAQAKVTHTPEGPLVALPGQSVGFISDGQLVTRVLPAGSTPLLPRPDGTVIVADNQGQWWAISSSLVATDPSPIPAPAGYSPAGPIGLLGTQILYAWRTDDSTAPWLVTGHDPAAAMETVFQLPLGQQGGTQWASGRLWASSPDGTWGIFNRTLINPSAQLSRDLGNSWRTTSILDDKAYSASGSRLATVTPNGETTSETSPHPQVRFGTMHAVVNDHALISATTAGDTMLYALPADPTNPPK